MSKLFFRFQHCIEEIVVKCQHVLFRFQYCIEENCDKMSASFLFCFQYCIEENCDKMSTTQAKVVACLKDQKDGLKDLQVVF